eukprot:CCRYP_006759-RA/>CCRYP_006759-RA protein AED:0.44 eAED:0.44 QI:0/-1/0/1/-1/1/1/0/213
MKTTCIATVAILGCASAAPRRMRTSERSLQEGSMSMSMPEAAPGEPSLFDTGSTVAAVTIPAEIDATTVAAVPLPEEISMPGEPATNDEAMVEVSMSMSVPEVIAEEVVVEEVLWESLSIPAIFEEIYGSSMSIPEGWTPEAEGYVATETGGYVEPGSTEPTSGTDDTPSTDDTMEGESDDVPSGDREASPAAGVILSGVASAACVAGAIALF